MIMHFYFSICYPWCHFCLFTRWWHTLSHPIFLPYPSPILSQKILTISSNSRYSLLFIQFLSILLLLITSFLSPPFHSIPFYFFHTAHSGHHKGCMEHSSCSHSCLGCTEWCHHSMGFTSEESMVRHSCCHVPLGFHLLVTEAVLKLNVTSSPHKMSPLTLFYAFDLMMMPTSLYVHTYSPTLCTRGMQVRAKRSYRRVREWRSMESGPGSASCHFKWWW